MQALKLRKKVANGKIVLEIPKGFGPVVEVIILSNADDIEFWQEDELKNLGKIRVSAMNFDNEDYSQW